MKELRLVRLNLAALTLVDNLLQRYHDLKRKRGLLDFEDLITRTVALLARNGAGQWVQYKLDRGIDHILVDEAQDTSPDQWQVIRMLSEEFFSGLGQRNISRTLFLPSVTKNNRSIRFRAQCRRISRRRDVPSVCARKMRS
ncbi:UvrD-helicase domain-containing protein [Ochrobactrum intermedium]|nr:UvrD-helicase domain-containing protein [Brucella intermedia]